MCTEGLCAGVDWVRYAVLEEGLCDGSATQKLFYEGELAMHSRLDGSVRIDSRGNGWLRFIEEKLGE